MTIDETTLTKGHLRKLKALRKSVGDKLGDEVFAKWVVRQEKASAARIAAARRADPVAERIEEALAGFADDRTFNLSVYGYTVRRARGKGASGFVATRNEKS